MLTIVTLSDVPAAVRKKTVGTAGEWRAAGITPAQFRSLTRAGDLVRVRHGVYATRSAVESAASDPRQAHALRVAAAGAAVGRRAVASHQSAAVLHGIDLLRDPGGDAVLADPAARPVQRPAAWKAFTCTPPGFLSNM